MKFDCSKELAKLKSEWIIQEQIMRDEGISEEIIQQLYDFSFAQFKTDRNYYLHKEEYTCITDQIDQTFDINENFNFLEQVENPELLKGLKQLSSDNYKLFYFYAVKGLSQVEIANLTNQPKQNVCNKISRIKKYLKKFL